jgi:hypothetical protein
MLRAASPVSIATGDPYGTASFPLVPYSNRIGNGKFEWDGKQIGLARNFSPEPHSIHGVGFELPWTVRSRADDRIVLELDYRPGAAWPWPFEAQQIIAPEIQGAGRPSLAATSIIASRDGTVLRRLHGVANPWRSRSRRPPRCRLRSSASAAMSTASASNPCRMPTTRSTGKRTIRCRSSSPAMSSAPASSFERCRARFNGSAAHRSSGALKQSRATYARTARSALPAVP